MFDLVPIATVLSVALVSALAIVSRPEIFRPVANLAPIAFDAQTTYRTKATDAVAILVTAETSPESDSQPTARLLSWARPQLARTLTQHIRGDQRDGIPVNLKIDGELAALGGSKIRLIDVPHGVTMVGATQLDDRTWEPDENAAPGITMVIGDATPSEFNYGVEVYDDQGYLVDIFRNRVRLQPRVAEAQPVLSPPKRAPAARYIVRSNHSRSDADQAPPAVTKPSDLGTTHQDRSVAKAEPLAQPPQLKPTAAKLVEARAKVTPERANSKPKPPDTTPTELAQKPKPTPAPATGLTKTTGVTWIAPTKPLATIQPRLALGAITKDAAVQPKPKTSAAARPTWAKDLDDTGR
jgi:hypothetical protein